MILNYSEIWQNLNKYFIDDTGFISKPMLLFNETH